MTPLRTRLAVGLLSFAVIGLELTLMRSLSLRFWHHFAAMVISVALLGFGASGTALVLLRGRIRGREGAWLCALALGFSLSVPLTVLAASVAPLDVHFLAWHPLRELVNAAVIELLMCVPFFFAGAVVGVALMDGAERISGHYAANLAGSGAGAVGAVLLMSVFDVYGLLVTMAAVGYLAGAMLLPWRRRRAAGAGIAVGAALCALLWLLPGEAAVSPYKMLSLARHLPGTRTLCRSHGPLGRVDAVAGPSIHHAPGLSLQFQGKVPAHILLLMDGDQASVVYNVARGKEWEFLDHTTAAAAYAMRARPRALILGAGGGADIGLALYHDSREVVALEMNPQVISAMRGPLSAYGGDLYNDPRVRVVNDEVRGYLAGARERFDVIQLPPTDSFGASGAGLYATQASYLYTVEAVSAMLERLSEGGVLCLTRWARMPPRDGLRLFHLAAAALRRRGLNPARHVAMIRNWATVTVLASRRPFADRQTAALRAFCEQRAFDVCYFPGIREGEVNRFHVLDGPRYAEAAHSLLGPDRDTFLSGYIFRLDAPTDDKPFFFNFLRWRTLPSLKRRFGGQAPAFLELGTLFLAAALLQALFLGGVLILLPLAPGIRALRVRGDAAAVLTYFLLIGAGFMLLEMGFLQRLILYLAHPTYAAAVSLSSFLVFAGVGSWISRWWKGSYRRRVGAAGGVVAGLAMLEAVFVERWLGLTQAWPVSARFAVAVLTIAPLAIAMGHLFPLGMQRLRQDRPALVPWAWAVNGCASVAATVAAPMLAMQVGFSRVVWVAVVCYAAAAVLGRGPGGETGRTPAAG